MPISTARHRGFDLAVSAVLMAAAVTLVAVTLERRYSGKPMAFELPAEPQSLEGAPIRGSIEAPVGVIMYSDFACRYCTTFARTVLPMIDREYVNPGRVLLAFRYLPLSGSGSTSLDAAKAADCADSQQRFWEAHDRLFAPTRSLAREGLSAAMEDIGLDMAVWSACMEEDSGARIVADLGSARTLRVRSTPFFLVGPVENGAVRVTTHLDGLAPVSVFAETLNALLERIAALHSARPE